MVTHGLPELSWRVSLAHHRRCAPIEARRQPSLARPNDERFGTSVPGIALMRTFAARPPAPGRCAASEISVSRALRSEASGSNRRSPAAATDPRPSPGAPPFRRSPNALLPEYHARGPGEANIRSQRPTRAGPSGGYGEVPRGYSRLVRRAYSDRRLAQEVGRRCRRSGGPNASARFWHYYPPRPCDAVQPR